MKVEAEKETRAMRLQLSLLDLRPYKKTIFLIIFRIIFCFIFRFILSFIGFSIFFSLLLSFALSIYLYHIIPAQVGNNYHLLALPIYAPVELNLHFSHNFQIQFRRF